MILYDWKKVRRCSNESVRQLLSIVKYITYRPIPEDKYDKNYGFSQINWSGSSFLLNPEPLFKNRAKLSDKEIADYIHLASLRNYSDYLTLGKTTLDLYIVEKNENLIRLNRLLYIEEDQVVFKYEEETQM